MALAQRPQWFKEARTEQEAGDGGAFAAGDDERIDGDQLSFGADLEGFGADAAQRYLVLLEVPLEREYTDAWS